MQVKAGVEADNLEPYQVTYRLKRAGFHLLFFFVGDTQQHQELHTHLKVWYHIYMGLRETLQPTTYHPLKGKTIMIRARRIENNEQFIAAYESIKNTTNRTAVTLHLDNDNIVLAGATNEEGDTIHYMKRFPRTVNREQQVQELHSLAETLNQATGAQFTLNVSTDTGHVITGGYVDANYHPGAGNPNAEYITVWVHPERYANFNQAERNLTEALTNGEITATITTKDGHGYWGTVPTHTFTHNGYRYFVEPHNPNTFKEGTYTLTAANIIHTHTTRPIDAGRMTIIATPAE